MAEEVKCPSCGCGRRQHSKDGCVTPGHEWCKVKYMDLSPRK